MTVIRIMQILLVELREEKSEDGSWSNLDPIKF